jgi:hypothetical protein
MHYVSAFRFASRSTRLALALAVAAIAALVAFAPAAGAAAGPSQWSLRFGGAATTNAPFSLYNQDKGSEVVYGSQPWCAINLAWSSGTHRDWRFERAAGSTGPIRYNEPLALKNIPRGTYLYYNTRICGINLNWSSIPQYQWRLRGGTAGAPISTTNLQLFNDTEGDVLVHAWRPWGINLKWLRDT